MTWTYELFADGSADIYDHNGDLVTSLAAGKHEWPVDVLAVMNSEMEARNWDTAQTYVTETLKDALMHDIEER